MNRLLLTCVASLASMSAANATDYYVDIHGTAPGTGTLADPFTSIEYAATRPYLQPFDTLIVFPGTYVGNITDLWIDARSVAGPEVTIIAPSGVGHTVRIDSQFAKLEGFTVLPPLAPSLPGFPSNVFVYEGIVENCILRNDGARRRGGIWIDSGATVRDCTITGMTHGVNVNGFDAGCVMVNSIISGNDQDVLFSGASAPLVSIDYCAGISNINPDLNGAGNVSGPVGFWEPNRPDLHLRPGSPCIDAGDPASPLDPDGSRHDIGALTYDPGYAPQPLRYCAGKLNSDGCVPEIGAIGSASASSSAYFSITASHEVAGKTGLMFFGFGERAQPFQGGLHCITLPTKRVGAQTAAGSGPCGGSYEFDMGAYIQSGVHPGLIPGAMVFAQWWSRDPLEPQGFGTGLSDALSFGIAP